VDENVKATLLSQFAAYLDAETPEHEPDDMSKLADLYSVFVELAGLRNEVRTESRMVKDALVQFRAVFEVLQANQATMQKDLDRARAEARGQAVLRPLLLDVIDLRDRLVAALKLVAPRKRSWPMRMWRREDSSAGPWEEGLRMTLRRLDQVLADRQVVPIESVGQQFDPLWARAVAVSASSDSADGVVIEEVRTGFLWEDQVLRIADVIVAKGA
jgi:molecular chaperone GrpE